MCDSPRLYTCVGCHCQVIICRHCDRGNPYCSGECSSQSRRKKQREAAARHQSSPKGRHAHAQRQLHYRQRLKQKVTHQGSPLMPYDSLYVEPKSVIKPIKKQPFIEKLAFICHFCGRYLGETIRIDFIHRQSRKILPVYSF